LSDSGGGESESESNEAKRAKNRKRPKKAKSDDDSSSASSDSAASGRVRQQVSKPRETLHQIVESEMTKLFKSIRRLNENMLLKELNKLKDMTQTLDEKLDKVLVKLREQNKRTPKKRKGGGERAKEEELDDDDDEELLEYY